MTGRFTPVPVVSGSLGASIYTDRVICGKRGLEIRTPKDSYVGSIYSFREYPATTRPGMLNVLLSLDFPLVLTQSFSFLTRSQAHSKLSLKSSQMLSSGDKAVTQISKLSEAEDALASNEFVMGAHHVSLAYMQMISIILQIEVPAPGRDWRMRELLLSKRASAWRRLIGRSCQATISGARVRERSHRATSLV